MVYANHFTERELKKEHKRRILMVFPMSFLIVGIITSFLEHRSIADDLMNIFLSPTTLLTDFLVVGGIGSSFINAAIIGFVNIYLLKRYEMRVNGLLIAAILTVLGFSFIGKNILNVMPIYLGGYLYSKYQRIPTKNILLVMMFSTALSPLVSEITFGGIFDEGFNYMMGILSGTTIGFIIVPLSSYMMRFHDGYNLYNIGFTAGILGMVVTSFLRSFKIEINPVYIVYEQNHFAIVGLFFAIFIFLMAVGYWINPDVLKSYKSIFVYKGRTVTDFTSLVGYGMTFFNMGVMGMVGLAFVFILQGHVNGPVIASLMTIVGFSAFGKHPGNCLPIMAGVLLGGLFFKADFSSTGFIISVLFSTTIAPIAGAFGPIIGVVAGILHLTLVTNTGIIHGGINLYNNGFAGGLVAGFLLPIIDAFRTGDRNGETRNQKSL